MSSFLVSDLVINRIVSALEWGSRKSGDLYPNPRYIDERLYTLTETRCKEVGNRLYNLNVAAIKERYPDTINNPDRMPGGSLDENGKHLPYQYKPMLPGSDRFQVLKSLQCLIYQCSEGTIVDHPLYKALRDYESELCKDIVSDIPEYKNSQWDETEVKNEIAN